MAIKSCKNGHYYNDSEHSTCPYCSGESAIGHTVPLGPEAGIPGGPGATEFLNTVAPAVQANFSPTVAPNAEEQFDKTVTLDSNKNSEIVPVRGWLVVVEGEKLGLDFKIHTGNNSVGRAKSNQVCVDFDETISKEKACFVIYDEENNAFHVMIGESSNNIYVNKDLLLAPRRLMDNDIIKIGKTKLVFRSLCNDQFTY